MKRIFAGLVVLAVWILHAPAAVAQQPQPADLLATMQAISAALGVKCEYCHSAPQGSGVPEPKKDIARAMMAMTRELNAKVQAATGKSASEATNVQCVTCHRGVAIPRPLSQIIVQTLREKGAEAAVAQYRDLRARYYGHATYDFSEDELLGIAQRLAQVRPDDAIALLQLNIEFVPRPARSYAALSFAYTRKYDDASAIVNLERALELDPDNGEFRGRLEQLKMYQRRGK